MTDHDTALEAAARALIRSHGYSEAVVTPVLVQAYMPTVQCIITAYNEAIGGDLAVTETELDGIKARYFESGWKAGRADAEAENERLRDRIDSLRDGLAEVAAGEPDVTPAGLPTALRSRAKSTLDIDDEDAALHPQAITGKGGCDVCGSMSIEPHLPSCPVLHPQEGNDD